MKESPVTEGKHTPDGGYAFPMKDALNAHFKPLPYSSHGMTLRDYFAAQALTGCVASVDRKADNLPTDQELAAEAFALADAMLSERSK